MQGKTLAFAVVSANVVGDYIRDGSESGKAMWQSPCQHLEGERRGVEIVSCCILIDQVSKFQYESRDGVLL